MTRAYRLVVASALLGCGTDPAGDGGADSATGGDTDTDTGADVGSGTSSDGSVDEETGAPSDCEIPAYEDDIVLRFDDASVLPGEAHRIVALGEGTIACGDGFFAHAGAVGASPSVLQAPELAGHCTGLSALEDGRALVATAQGRVSLIGTDGEPTILSSGGDGTTRFYDVVGTTSEAWVAAGTQGVLHFSIADDTFTAAAPTPGAVDARGLALAESALVVADGYRLGDIEDPTVGGAVVQLLDAAGGGSLAEVVTGPGIASRAMITGGRAVVLRPGYGFDVLELGADSLSLQYSMPVGEAILDAAFDSDDMIAAAGSRLLRFTLGDDEAVMVSSEDRPDGGDVLAPWFRSVVRTDTGFAAGLGEALAPLDVGAGDPSPEISPEAHTFTMSADQTEALFSFDNLGDSPLIVTGIEVEAPFTAEIAADLNPPREGCADQFEVAPGGKLLFFVRAEGVSDHTPRTIRFLSNDADEPELAGTVEIMRPVPEPGDPGEDFHLLDVNGDDFDFSAQLGKVVLAKLYNPL
ncbi:MAG: hypothetical protein AAF721_15520 [Myxococcota bacterium]